MHVVFVELSDSLQAGSLWQRLHRRNPQCACQSGSMTMTMNLMAMRIMLLLLLLLLLLLMSTAIMEGIWRRWR